MNWENAAIKPIQFKELKSFNIMEIITSEPENPINHEYYPIPEISNLRLLKLLNRCCFNPTPLLNDDNEESILNEIEDEDLNEEDINKILDCSNIRLIEVMIITMIKCKKQIESIIIYMINIMNS